MSPRISVVLATYNGGQYLEEQLNTLSEQRLLPDELVVSDDGSSDETLAILSRFARHARIDMRLIENEGHVGWARNFIRALSHAHGELVAFCDQDDLWYPNKIWEQSRVMRGDATIALTTHTWRHLVGGVQGKIHSSFLGRSSRFARGDSDALPPRPVPGMTMMIRRDVAESICRWWPGWYDETDPLVSGASVLAHDSFAVDVAASLGDLVVIDQPLAARRLHAANASMTLSDRAPRLTLGRHHKSVRSWGLRVVRMRERARLYSHLNLSKEGALVEQFFLARAKKYAAAGSAYESRCSIYNDGSFGRRFHAFKSMLNGGYGKLGKKRFETCLTAVRDFAAVVGWRRP